MKRPASSSRIASIRRHGGAAATSRRRKDLGDGSLRHFNVEPWSRIINLSLLCCKGRSEFAIRFRPPPQPTPLPGHRFQKSGEISPPPRQATSSASWTDSRSPWNPTHTPLSSENAPAPATSSRAPPFTLTSGGDSPPPTVHFHATPPDSASPIACCSCTHPAVSRNLPANCSTKCP